MSLRRHPSIKLTTKKSFFNWETFRCYALLNGLFKNCNYYETVDMCLNSWQKVMTPQIRYTQTKVLDLKVIYHNSVDI